jgi:hypothetical protein
MRQVKRRLRRRRLIIFGRSASSERSWAPNPGCFRPSLIITGAGDQSGQTAPPVLLVGPSLDLAGARQLGRKIPSFMQDSQDLNFLAPVSELQAHAVEKGVWAGTERSSPGRLGIKSRRTRCIWGSITSWFAAAGFDILYS